jgi:hypothetical protein
MNRLYHASRSRSTRMLWLLEEFGLPYTVEYARITRMDSSDRPDARNPRPYKKVPAIVRNDVLVSAADALIASLGHWSRKMLPADAVIDDYLARVNARPALQRGFAKDHG